MTRLRAVQPAPIKHDFSNFAGELCPICRENRLVAALKYPVCMRCREKYNIKEYLLRTLSEHRLIIDQETLDWEEEPYPTLTGTLDDSRFEAVYIPDNKWQVSFIAEPENKRQMAALIKKYLNSVTAGWRKQAENKRTKIRRYIFFVAAGATIVSASYFIKKAIKRTGYNKK